MGSLLEDILFVETRNNARLSLEPRGGERRGVGGGAPDGMIPLSHALTHSKLRRAKIKDCRSIERESRERSGLREERSGLAREPFRFARKASKVPVNVSRSIFPNNAETTRYLPKNWANIVFKSRQGPMALETKRAPEFRDNQQGSLGGAHHLRKRLQL